MEKLSDTDQLTSMPLFGMLRRDAAFGVRRHDVASAADAMKLVTCAQGGQIRTYGAIVRRETTTGPDGYLMGGQEDAVDLQYIGANTFVPISHEGSLNAQ